MSHTRVPLGNKLPLLLFISAMNTRTVRSRRLPGDDENHVIALYYAESMAQGNGMLQYRYARSWMYNTVGPTYVSLPVTVKKYYNYDKRHLNAIALYLRIYEGNCGI
ncbi:uncharacterized protein LAESUDRAFT_337912 [Laetiporus sulphureus 93-53]|uniref:Uncharacterized protein n=1 Tax=Laetiporus sulphureus 93-53 TaxID=1314785 RepID=A0A165CWF5_9APHY|nr:uncharacterized protein LAESUDRAFT_337912 [Laetiporus sulphureus 93-53]KZT03578.1 hypothetical protein LAESUDRAFT_337912 [Laetiporus sulphureus 93-53]